MVKPHDKLRKHLHQFDNSQRKPNTETLQISQKCFKGTPTSDNPGQDCLLFNVYLLKTWICSVFLYLVTL